MRARLGDPAFFSGLAAFTRAHAGGSVRTEALQQALERASGVQLGAFFRDYVFGVVALPDTP